MSFREIFPTIVEWRANLWNDLVVLVVPLLASWLFKRYRSFAPPWQYPAVTLLEVLLALFGWKLISQYGLVATAPALALCLLPIVLLYLLEQRRRKEITSDSTTARESEAPLPSTLARSTRRREPPAGAERRNEIDGTVLVYVPGGEYILGATDLIGWDGPVHTVLLSPFWIGKYPVTNEQYKLFLRANPKVTPPEHWYEWWPSHPKHPVNWVMWKDAQAYCQWAGLCLPTEAQWEAAARGTDRRRYPWGNAEPTAKHTKIQREIGELTPVGAFPRGKGPFGTLDQVGNVHEWCEDVWDSDAYQTREGAHDPVVTESLDNSRCFRGGAIWRVTTKAAERGSADPQLSGLGFRCAASA
jgi:sulfatase modifying factor 1